MKMLKKIFCHHEYIYVDKHCITRFPGSDEYLFKFMCKKCQKKFFISSLKIENIINKFRGEANEKIAIDGFIDTSKTEIVIPIRLGYGHMNLSVNGIVADKTIDYFIKKYDINIRKIEKNN